MPRRAFITLAVLTLAGCSTAGTPFEGMFSDPTPPSCPDVRILGGASTQTQFAAGGGQDLTDITAEARFTSFNANCIEDIDPDTGIGTITVELNARFDVVRGPANSTGTATFPYFVTVTDREQNVINKNVFNMNVGFQRNAFRVKALDDTVALVIPIRGERKGADFIVYLGLQLTELDLEYNRRIGPALLGS